MKKYIIVLFIILTSISSFTIKSRCGYLQSLSLARFGFWRRSDQVFLIQAVVLQLALGVHMHSQQPGTTYTEEEKPMLLMQSQRKLPVHFLLLLQTTTFLPESLLDTLSPRPVLLPLIPSKAEFRAFRDQKHFQLHFLYMQIYLTIPENSTYIQLDIL